MDFKLIARYLSGEATPEEVQRLEAWMDSSEGNRELIDEYRALWDKMGSIGAVAGLDLDEEWQHQESLMQQSDGTGSAEYSAVPRRNVIFMASRIAVAAVVVLALVLGGIYGRGNLRKVTVASTEHPEEIRLPDGSQVTLNVHSELVYPRRFGKDLREVSLKGEAYFEVSSNPDKPFMITARELEVKVLGTSFNVNAYEDNDEIEVIVRTGRVAVTKPGEIPRTIILKPGNRAVYNMEKEDLSLSKNVDRNYLAWKTRSFVFEDISLSEVAETLNKVYGSRITIPSDSIKTSRITSTFNDQSLDAILNVLSATLDLEVVRSGEQIFLKESN